MNLAGIGVVFAGGRGVGAFEEALRQGWMPPRRSEVATASSEGTMPVYSVEEETLKDKTILRKLRRADRFSKMAVLAACDAVKDSGIVLEEGGTSLGIILASAFGPQVTAFRFLDEIIDYGDSSVSPTLFSHSVHNAAASYVASALENRGPTLTVTQFGLSFHQALVLGQAWIQEGRCDNVLVGSVEELGTVMEFVCGQKLRIAEDGRIRPFECSPTPRAVPGEGSVFLLLGGEGGSGKYGGIRGVSFDDEPAGSSPDLCVLDADGMSEDETCYQQSAGGDVAIAGYSPLFGSMMTGSAFHCAAAALMLTKQTRYGCPVQDNPHQMRVCTSTEPCDLEAIHCVKYSCTRGRVVIALGR
jgi:3-oxoacyl-[acyl-carrier-protein] synthase II